MSLLLLVSKNLKLLVLAPAKLHNLAYGVRTCLLLALPSLTVLTTEPRLDSISFPVQALIVSCCPLSVVDELGGYISTSSVTIWRSLDLCLLS